ncbi:hypothetical protein F5X99DRAFT_390936 [Biscogniauxia marginata]|nr:hypothetical protein F5X99DRAFT_390936 [Biscogniauxia marginata]
MFTGLIEEIGVVTELDPNDETGGTSLTIALPETSTLLADAQLGDSISINGVCLTATAIRPGSGSGAGDSGVPTFKVGIAPETLRLTNLGALVSGSPVNLERAVRADTRMGGHFVQGHVDAVAEITRVEPDGNALTFRFSPRAVNTGADADADDSKDKVMRYIVYKGYVALDGTSLTVTRVNDLEGWWEVMLISYTQEKVALARKKVGDTVNVEVDVLAKYAEKNMAGYLGEDVVRPVIEKIVQNLVTQAMGGHSS